MKIRWWRVFALLVGSTLCAGILASFGVSFWWRCAAMQVPLMIAVWLTKPVTWEES